MSRIAYVNGRYVDHAEAAVHIEDRGFQFADGVYEVIAIENGRLVDEEPHIERLDRSLSELGMDWAIGPEPMRAVMREVARRNRVTNGIVYLQITRGVAPRDHAYPADAATSLVITARSRKPKAAAQQSGVKVITVPEIRWLRRDIKTVSLLPNCMAKQQAVEAGAYEAWFIEDDGTVTEGTSTNAWIVTKNKELVTRPPDNSILNGVTRRSVASVAIENGYHFVERAFSLEEALSAAEVFLTSTTSNVMPVIRIDDTTVGMGEPGPLTQALQELYAAHAASA